MWLAADGVVHSVAIPSDSPLLAPLIELLRSLPMPDRQVLDERRLDVVAIAAQAIADLGSD